MAESEVTRRKRALRGSALQLGGGDRREATRTVLERLLTMPELLSASRVALYAAIQDEVPLGTALRHIAERGGRAAMPRLIPSGMEFREVRPDKPLRPGYRGILEPGPEALRVDLRKIDLFVVPGLLFDRTGGRLGRGGGYYDRALAEASPDALRVGICYADRIVETLPFEEWDIPMNLVVTESEVIRASRETQ
ncbi:MAG: 5-formyltetrahydrofolate cyclo-ligase [bacterium]|nr:5-formyltetrahydrofolate cyclo-ligase [bacterium]